MGLIELTLMQKSQLISLKTKIPLLLWFVYGIIGWILTPDYGVSWDEMGQREHGLVAFDHIVKTTGIDVPLFFPKKTQRSAPGRQYTVLFSLTAASLERLLNISAEDIRGQLLLRHYLVFLLFWVGLAYFYKLLKLISPDWALTGTIVLVLSPRIFAHSFFNPKDIVLLVFYIIGAYSMVRLIDKPGIKNALIHGVVCGLVVNARQPGLIVLIATFLLFFLDLLQHKFDRKLLLKQLKLLPVLGGSFLVTALLFFPYLWESPIRNATLSIGLMAKFPWDAPVLFMGKFMKANETPWYYIFVWMGITTPVFYLVIALSGMALAVKNQFQYLKSGFFWKTERQLITLSLLILFIAPFVAIFLLNSTLYDGWRHLYFTYPPLIGLGVFGWSYIHEKLRSRERLLLNAGGGIYLIFILITMIDLHPFEYVYFNPLAKRPLHTQYEMDYWGMSYKQAFEALVKVDTDTTLMQINCANHPGIANYYFLPKEIRSRMKLRFGMEVAHYYLSNYRFPYEWDRFMAKSFPFDRPVLIIKVGDSPINGVYRVKNR